MRYKLRVCVRHHYRTPFLILQQTHMRTLIFRYRRYRYAVLACSLLLFFSLQNTVAKKPLKGQFISANSKLDANFASAFLSVQHGETLVGANRYVKLLSKVPEYSDFASGLANNAIPSQEKIDEFNRRFLLVKRGTSVRHDHVLYPDSVFYLNNSVLANIVPLALDFTPREYKQEVARNVVKTLLAKYPNLTGNDFSGVPCLLQTLSDNGFSDVAYLLATSEYAQLLDKNDLVDWCRKYLGGIRNVGDVYKDPHFEFCPCLDIQDLDNVDASVETPFGRIRSYWYKTLENLYWRVEIPEGMTADAYLPNGEKMSYEAGIHITQYENMPAGGKNIVHDEFVYSQTDFPQCHASSIVELKNGDLVATYFGGTKERNPDVCIWVNHKPKGSDTWTAPMLVADGVFKLGTPNAQIAGIDTACAGAECGPIVGINTSWKEAKSNKPRRDYYRKACWNPVLFEMPDGELWLFFKIGHVMNDWTGWVVKSRDGGQTWSEKEPLEKGFLGPVKNKPVIVDNRLICPSSTENEGGWKFHFEILDLKTGQWKYVGPIERELCPLTPDMAAHGSLLKDGTGKHKLNPIYCIQPSILKLSDGRLQAIGRTRNGRLASTWSSDNGDSWTKVKLIDVPNNQSGTDAVTLRRGRHVLIYNDFGTIPGTPKGPRNPLSIAVSDNGTDWNKVLTLEDSPIGDYSYPAIVEGRDGTLHCVYTWRRYRIAYKNIRLR